MKETDNWVNKITIDGKTIITYPTYILINGERFDIPKHIQSSGNSVSVVDGSVYINGYSFENGEWNMSTKTFAFNYGFLAVIILVILGIFLSI